MALREKVLTQSFKLGSYFGSNILRRLKNLPVCLKNMITMSQYRFSLSLLLFYPDLDYRMLRRGLLLDYGKW
ncbi:hypothetical protein GIB67_003440 [Kingdonia uniflora]|uniref:Uncharacterized protein n=1 Tax=Kingdonia uniflora TaxID=39325 RepID=A0A7J7P9I7_9MAGN|nr:hypothetical protein GIB67_003440 [Kingdonia uniflora]